MKKDGKGGEKKKVKDKKKGMEKDKKRWRKINETRSCNCRLSLSRYLLLSFSDHGRKDKEERKKRRRIEKE